MVLQNIVFLLNAYFANEVMCLVLPEMGQRIQNIQSFSWALALKEMMLCICSVLKGHVGKSMQGKLPEQLITN